MPGVADLDFTTAMRNIATSLANQKTQPLGITNQPQTQNTLIPATPGLGMPTNDQRSNMAPADTFLKQMGRLLGNKPS
jgi:hypothetical protein